MAITYSRVVLGLQEKGKSVAQAIASLHVRGGVVPIGREEIAIKLP